MGAGQIATEVVLSADASGQPLVVRVGSTVRRVTQPGSHLVASLLEHLEIVGFDGSPRFLGYDKQGRQVLSFVEGEVQAAPSWQHDDTQNAAQLGQVAKLLRRLHDATAGFVAPPGLEPIRPLPIPGSVWTHSDVGLQNIVFREGRPVAFIDWEFAAPADILCDIAGLLALSTRGPKPDATDNDRRRQAVAMACKSLVGGYGLTDPTDLTDLPDAATGRLREAAAIVLDDAANYWDTIGHDPKMIFSARWRAEWFRTSSEG